MDWSHIPTFLAVLDAGSLSGAARLLRTSQPTIGRQIAAMEETLGVVLFHRAPRGLVATETALDLEPMARRMAKTAAGMEMAAAGRSGAVIGIVRVTASAVVATYILPEIIAGIMADAPGLEIELVASNRNENLILREADIAVRMVAPTQNDLFARKIGDLGMGFYAHGDYLARSGTPRMLADLAAHVMIGYDRSDLILKAAAAMGWQAQRGDFAFRTDDQVVFMEAIAAGVGIGAAMHCLMAARPGVVQVSLGTPIPPLPVYVAAHRELKSAARVRFVFDRLGQGLAAYVDPA